VNTTDSEAGHPQTEGGSSPGDARGGVRGRLRELTHGHQRIWAAVMAMFAGGGTLAAILSAQSVAHTDADRARLAFHLSSAEITSTLKLAIQHEEDLVVSGSAFIAGNPHASATQFDRWAESARALQRYPELQDLGLVVLVKRAQLASFEKRIAAHPVKAFGPHSPVPGEPFQVLPAGERPYYCFAVAGFTRSLASYLPTGLDYCAFARALLVTRDSGHSSYAPFASAAKPTLGVETPVYSGGVVPATVAARRRTYVGWLGELLVPEVVLDRALEGHANTAVTFRYSAGASHVVFDGGSAPGHAQSATIDMHNGWTVQAFGPPRRRRAPRRQPRCPAAARRGARERAVRDARVHPRHVAHAGPGARAREDPRAQPGARARPGRADARAGRT
jgi:CHASE domain